jgi:hypothetical protein
MNPKFDIIFRGDVVFGHQLPDVKLRLQQLFKMDSVKIDALFSGKPITLKRDLDETSAQKYKQVLLNAGVDVEVRAMRTEPQLRASQNQIESPSPEKKRMIDSASSAAGLLNSLSNSPVAKAAPTDWSLADIGSDLLLSGERHQSVPVEVDVSAITLKAQEGNILEPSELPSVHIFPVAIPDLSVAELGEDMLSEEDKPLVMLPIIEEHNWGLSIVDLNVELAPVGADLGQIPVNREYSAPDVSHLHLVE